jgi:hypothetical protein
MLHPVRRLVAFTACAGLTAAQLGSVGVAPPTRSIGSMGARGSRSTPSVQPAGRTSLRRLEVLKGTEERSAVASRSLLWCTF